MSYFHQAVDGRLHDEIYTTGCLTYVELDRLLGNTKNTWVSSTSDSVFDEVRSSSKSILDDIAELDSIIPKYYGYVS